MKINHLFILRLTSITLIMVIFQTSTAIQWENVEPGIRQSNQCDFPGTELIRTIRSTNLTECGNKCQFSNGCTHFVWNQVHQNGTCWIKTGRVSDNVARAINDANTVCGHLIILWHFSTELDDDGWSFNCDFPSDREFKSEKSKGEHCGDLCRANPPCSHFTWTNRQSEGGMCRMKYGDDISRNDAILTPGSLGSGSTCGFNREKITNTVTPVDDTSCDCDCSK